MKTKCAGCHFKVGDPYFSDIPEDNPTVISCIKDLQNLTTALQNELEEVDDPYYSQYWKGKSVRHNLNYGIYFRGESDSNYKLRPQIGRMKEGLWIPKYEPEQERNFLHRFRRRSYSHYQRILTDWETIFLAQHHGLPTRLLDWTSNQLVALFWACWSEENLNKDGSIYAFVRQPDENWDLNVFDVPLFQKYEYPPRFAFHIKGIKVIYPFHVSPRITAHGGLFTIQDNPYKPLTEYSTDNYTREYFDIFHIRKWKVSSDAKYDLRIALNNIGINIHTLHLDLDGLAESIKLTEEMRWAD
jgi:hypothetical protein